MSPPGPSANPQSGGSTICTGSQNGPPKRVGPDADNAEAQPTSTNPSAYQHSGSSRRQVTRFDGRCAARATEVGMEPIDDALTATGLAWELGECADRIAQP